MTIVGGVCILGLPIAQFPNIVPPEIQVKTHYTGANAETIEQSVAAPIVQVFGAGQYAMQMWVKPGQLAKLGITVPEIVSAIKNQNNVNPAGQIGSDPIPKGQKFTYAVRAQGRLQAPEEFA